MSFDPIKWHTTISKIIKDFNPEIDTSLGTIIGDTIILPLALNREILDKTTIFVSNLYSLDSILALLNDKETISDIATALNITPDEIVLTLRNILDNIASDYNITRQQAQYATGIVYYIPKNFDNGTYIITPSDKVKSIYNIDYKPEITQVFIVNDENKYQYYVPQLATYAFPVKVRCSISGRIGNISQGQIDYDFSSPTAPSTNYIRAINLEPITGGTDEETDIELVERIKSKWRGINFGSINGYKEFLNKYNIFDAYIAGPGDKYMYRSQYGAVDIYINDFQYITITIDINIENILGRPINEDEEIELYVKDIFPSYMYVKNVKVLTPNVEIVKYIRDNTILWKWSTRANDKITLKNNTGEIINILTFNITYNASISKIQKLLDLPENKVLGLDIMVREAWPLEISIFCDIQPFIGFSPVDLQNQIKKTVLEYVNSLRLNSKLATSDLINIIEDISGVDVVRNLRIIKDNNVIDEIKASEIEFLKIKEILITVT